MADGEAKYFLGHKEVSEEEYRAVYPLPDPGDGAFGAPSSKGWPMVSDAMGVHPKQIDEARALDKKKGAPPTEYNKKGQPVFTSERHKRAFLKAHKVHDNNSYGG